MEIDRALEDQRTMNHQGYMHEHFVMGQIDLGKCLVAIGGEETSPELMRQVEEMAVDYQVPIIDMEWWHTDSSAPDDEDMEDTFSGEYRDDWLYTPDHLKLEASCRV